MVRASIVTVLVLAAGYLLTGELTPTASERAYLAWPPAWLAGWLTLRRAARPRPAAALGRAWLTVASCGLALAAALAVDVLGLIPELAAGVVTRVAYCLLGWMLLATVLRAGFRGMWACCVPGGRLGWLRDVAWLALLVAVAAPVALSYMQVHPIKRRPASDPRSRFGLDFETVTFRSADGTRLAGWFVPAPGSDRTVLLVHGVIDHRGGMLPFVRVLHAGGYNVLAFDFRGHGDSGGWTVTYGRREPEDIAAALDLLERRHPQAARRIAGVGWSMGASCLILAAARDPRLEALHLDAPFATTRDMARHIGRDMPGWQAWWMFRVGTAVGSLESGTNLFRMSPAAAVAEIAPRPIMIVHGQRDRVIPIQQGRAVFEAAREPKSFHVVAGAGHCATLHTEGAPYIARMLDFLDAALGTPGTPAVPRETAPAQDDGAGS